MTRTSSACLGPAAPPSIPGGDSTERWCEEFAAAILLPREELEPLLGELTAWRPGERISDLRPIAQLARKRNVSVRAAALRLIKAGLAASEVYGAIAQNTDQKRRGGGGGEGRLRHRARRAQLGARTVRIILDALGSGVLTTSDALDYLDVGYSDLEPLRRATQPPESA